MDYQIQRKRLVKFIKNQLMGFSLEGNTLIGEKPLDRIVTGFLFPIFESADGSGLDSENDDDYSTDEEATETKPVKKEKRYIPPSSAGFSFYITGKQIRLRVFHDAVFYKKVSDRDGRNQKFAPQQWEKKQLTDDDGDEVEFTPDGVTQYTVLTGKAKIDALWRKHSNGYIVTITISNTQKLDNDGSQIFYQHQNEFTLFEVKLKCIVEEGNVDSYPAKNKALLSDEEKEIELRYKDLRIYAVGHGTAVDWARNNQNQMEIWSDFMPTVEVPQVTADTGEKGSTVLGFNFLSKCESDNEVIVELKEFVNDYDHWIEEQQTKANAEDVEDQRTAKNMVDRIVTAKSRMEQGIYLLEQDELAKTAFAIANKAMLMQMIASDQAKGKTVAKEQYKWRPFQLAFVLMVLESSINEDSEFRDTLDLIWFPTGGGKTEAYLGLMAFLFIYRRLKYPASYGGTISIMRYTLRLLTSQ